MAEKDFSLQIARATKFGLLKEVEVVLDSLVVSLQCYEDKAETLTAEKFANFRERLDKAEALWRAAQPSFCDLVAKTTVENSVG